MIDPKPDLNPVDWRGTPITPGALVIYGGPVGRSIQLVEAIVADPMLTKSGRIWLNIVRRAYHDADDGRVHVGADRLTVVEALPPTALPTATEVKERLERRRVAREAYVTAAHEVERHGGEMYGHYETRTEERTLSPWRPPETRTWREWVTCDGCAEANKRFIELWEAGEIT